MNWYKKSQSDTNKRVKIVNTNFLYKKKYPKIIINIPGLNDRFYNFLRDDIKNAISTKINDYGEKWLLKLLAYAKEKTGYGDITWLMFYRFKDNPETYWIDPSFMYVLAASLSRLGYDVSELQPHNKIREYSKPKIKGNISDKGVSISFEGFVIPLIQKQIKDFGFHGEKIGDIFFWNKKTADIKAQIYTVGFLGNLEVDSIEFFNTATSYFQQKLSTLPIEELIEIKNSIAQTGDFGQNHILPIIDKIIEKNVNTETGEIISRKIGK